jgi:hypothetical protein
MRLLNVIDLAAKKRDGRQFSDVELCLLIDGGLPGKIPVEAF